MKKIYNESSIADIEKLFDKMGNTYSYLPHTIGRIRQQKKINELFKGLLENGDVLNRELYGDINWVISYSVQIETEEPDNRTQKYTKLSNLAMNDIDFLRKEFKILHAKIEDARYKNQLKVREKERDALLQDKDRQLNLGSINKKWNLIDQKHSSEREGFVYVLSNESMPGLYKIGFTTQSPTKRAATLGGKESVPTPFIVEKYWRTKDPYIVEQMIHSELDKYKAGKEFFKLDIDLLINLVDEKFKDYVIDEDEIPF
tara:strand:- start:211749 stop:212522 length:774 start_codon:yes stop_codon:yes gene_type:complete